jgi:type IV pilus assembly protein PilF
VGGIDNEGDPQAALERRVELARQYIGRGDWENAKRNLELANNIDSGNASVHEAFGLVYQSTGEYDRAEASFKRALRIDPKLSRARNNYAAFLFFLGRYAEAEQEFAIVAEDSLYSGRPLAYINLGMSRLNLESSVGAEDAFSRALRMDRRNPIALLEMGYLRLAAGDVANAQSYYGVYRTVVPRQSPRGFMLGIDISRASGDKDAESSYELALRNLYPDSQEYQTLRAQQGLQ